MSFVEKAKSSTKKSSSPKKSSTDKNGKGVPDNPSPSSSATLRTEFDQTSVLSLSECSDGSSSGRRLSNAVPTSPSAKSDRPHKSAGWKTSKLFSRTMSSIDVLRTFKKSNASSQQNPLGQNEDADAKLSDKTPKTRISTSLKKKQTSGTRDVAILVSEVTSDECPTLFKPDPIKTNRSSSQDEGIVCKKEDLIFLIEASKRRPSQTSPTSRRTSFQDLKSSQSSLERNSLDDKSVSPLASRSTSRGSLRASSGSKDELEPPTVIVVEPDVGTSVDKARGVENVDFKQAKTDLPTEVEDEKVSEENIDEAVEAVSKVQWDDGSFVDAMMIGDAIEAFLRGSMGPVVSTEKRVSFQKS